MLCVRFVTPPTHTDANTAELALAEATAEAEARTLTLPTDCSHFGDSGKVKMSNADRTAGMAAKMMKNRHDSTLVVPPRRNCSHFVASKTSQFCSSVMFWSYEHSTVPITPHANPPAINCPTIQNVASPTRYIARFELGKNSQK